MAHRGGWRTPVRSACAIFAVLMALVAGQASPAQASGNHFDAIGPINTTRVDLGGGWTSTNQPNGAALLAWQRQGNTVTPMIALGYLSLSNSPGYCAAVRMRYYSGNTLLFEQIGPSPSLCTSGTGTVTQQVIGFGQYTNVLTRVDISVMVRTFNGPWQAQQTVSLYA